MVARSLELGDLLAAIAGDAPPATPWAGACDDVQSDASPSRSRGLFQSAGEHGCGRRLHVLVAFFGAVFFFCGPVTHAQLIVAHRGASHDAPENTLAAFRLAWQRGADGVEGDFRLTRDKQIVCIHDADTKRMANKKLVVAESTLAELKELDVGSWKRAAWRDERIPTLAEIIEVIPPDKMFFIELKTGPEIVAPLKEVLARSALKPPQCVIISFDSATIAACEKQIPDVISHWLSRHKKPENGDQWVPTCEKVVTTLKEKQCDGLGSEARREAFDAEFIANLKEAGFGTFHVWTVDDVPTARFYQQQGAYGITTNRPRYIRAGLAEAQVVGAAGK
jgi:glycerophosphoryl diester phosphodiesterase